MYKILHISDRQVFELNKLNLQIFRILKVYLTYGLIGISNTESESQFHQQFDLFRISSYSGIRITRYTVSWFQLTCLIRTLVYPEQNTVLRFYPLFNIFIVTMMTVQHSTQLLFIQDIQLFGNSDYSVYRFMISVYLELCLIPYSFY
jgi:hypothetical protein